MRCEFDIPRKFLLQGREFGMGAILAYSYQRRFNAGGSDYREPLLTCLSLSPKSGKSHYFHLRTTAYVPPLL